MTRHRLGIVLIVEDDPALRGTLCRVMQKAGYRTISLGRALAAYDLVAGMAGAIDLAVIDMVLPGMSGLDLAAWFSRDFPSFPVLYISGHIDSLAMECIARRAPERVLLKPFTPSQLLARIGLLLEKIARKGPANVPSEGRRRSGTGD